MFGEFADSALTRLLKWWAGMIFLVGIRNRRRPLTGGVLVLLVWAGMDSSQAALLWSDLGATQVHETGIGADILGGVLRRDDSAKGVLYFKFHVEPLSDATTEEYFAAFQLYEGSRERLAVGNALRPWD